jgi:cytochrome b561
MKRILKKFFETFILLLMICIAVIPVILSIAYGNGWLLLLFFTVPLAASIIHNI